MKLRRLLAALLLLLPTLAGADTLVVPGVVANSCSASQFSSAIAADGTLTCSQPANVTGNAATATALAANPSDCASNTFATTIAASGNLTCAAVSEPAFSFTDITTNNATSSAHGLLPKLSNTSTEYLSGTGVFSTPAGTGANTTLSNLGTTSINAALLFQTGIGIGSTAAPVKNFVFNLSGTYGTGSYTFAGTPTANRTITWPDASISVARTDAGQTFGGTNTFTGNVSINGLVLASGSSINIGAEGYIVDSLPQTPDTVAIVTATTSNSWNMGELGDIGFDFNNGPCGTSACTDPTINIHSHNQNTTQYRGYSSYGSAGRVIKTLTESNPTAVVRIPVASGAGTGGTINFTVFAADATDVQSLSGEFQFSVVNKAGTETCTTPTTLGTPLNSNSAGTLTCTLACDNSPTNAVDIQVNCTSSLTQTTLDAYYAVTMTGPGEPQPQ